MSYRLLADLVVFLHAAFIGFALLGGFLVFRWPRAAWFHLPAVWWGAAVEWFGWVCPLTPLENELRRAAGMAGYSEGFIERYVVPVVYPAALTRDVQVALGAALIIANVAIYFVAWRCRAGHRPQPP